jgi:uncharacterized protein
MELIWLDTIVEKLWKKHAVSIHEVEYVFKGRHTCRYIEKGRVKGDNVYSTSGQTADGRYPIVFFIMKQNGSIIPISARNMDKNERKLYGRT